MKKKSITRRNFGSYTPLGVFVPCMPPDELYIRLNGHLMASERKAAGVGHVMMCGECGERPLDLIYAHSPYAEEELFKGKFTECECGVIHGKEAPGMVWGVDMTPICPCCSFAHCTHKTGGQSMKKTNEDAAEEGAAIENSGYPDPAENVRFA